MTITIILDKERAEYIKQDNSAYYEVELFEVKDKINPDQVGVKITFPEWLNQDAVSLLMFHCGIRFGLEKATSFFEPNYKPTQFKDISVDGRN